jgi:hypothetical protein
MLQPSCHIDASKQRQLFSQKSSISENKKAKKGTLSHEMSNIPQQELAQYVTRKVSIVGVNIT